MKKKKLKHESPPTFEVANARVVVNAIALALTLSVSTKTITNYQRKGMPQLPQRGKFDLAACLQWWMQNVFEDDDTHAALRNHNLDLQNKRLERIENMEKGKLVDIQEVLDAWDSIATLTKQNLFAIPRKFAIQLVGLTPTENEDLLNRALREACQAIEAESLKRSNLKENQSEKAADIGAVTTQPQAG